MTRGPLLKQIAWICQYQLQGNEAILRSGYKPGLTAD